MTSSRNEDKSGALNRLRSVASHLSTEPTSAALTPTITSQPSVTQNMAAAPARPAITCHVLDTTCGQPAADVPVTLLSMPSGAPPPPSRPASITTPFSSSDPVIIATGTTNSDGRVAQWDYARDENEQVRSISTEKGGVYMLRFETRDYFVQKYGGGGGFFPWIDVVFEMGGGETADADGRAEEERKHYHVPVLLSRFGYSTYRGS